MLINVGVVLKGVFIKLNMSAYKSAEFKVSSITLVRMGVMLPPFHMKTPTRIRVNELSDHSLHFFKRYLVIVIWKEQRQYSAIETTVF